MTDKELMQMALDALEHLQTDIEWQYKSPTRTMLRKVEKALRARLSQCDRCGEINPAEIHTCTPKEQWEAVAYRALDKVKELQRLLDEAQPEQEPFCYHDGRNIVDKEFADHSDVFPLYTAPPLRQWQGLTEEDLFDIAIVNFGEPDLQLFIEMGKLVQEELKEKNT